MSRRRPDQCRELSRPFRAFSSREPSAHPPGGRFPDLGFRIPPVGAQDASGNHSPRKMDGSATKHEALNKKPTLHERRVRIQSLGHSCFLRHSDFVLPDLRRLSHQLQRRRHGEFVAAFVFDVAAVSCDGGESHVVLREQRVERLPQLDVLHRDPAVLFAAASRWPSSPASIRALSLATYTLSVTTSTAERRLERGQPFDHRHQLHLVVRGERPTARFFFPVPVPVWWRM